MGELAWGRAWRGFAWSRPRRWKFGMSEGLEKRAERGPHRLWENGNRTSTAR
ncbi:MAG: hypothetical protein IKD07_01975 [Clostridia bacterium]|nr:hypothetical protein [Clostridia bacterium]